MSEYINRQEVIEALARWSISPIVIAPMQSADVVEVVRCRDCKFSKREDGRELWCTCRGSQYMLVAYDDYCSYGERAEE